jgi:hypothetical protein
VASDIIKNDFAVIDPYSWSEGDLFIVAFTELIEIEVIVQPRLHDLTQLHFKLRCCEYRAGAYRLRIGIGSIEIFPKYHENAIAQDLIDSTTIVGLLYHLGHRFRESVYELAKTLRRGLIVQMATYAEYLGYSVEFGYFRAQKRYRLLADPVV